MLDMSRKCLWKGLKGSKSLNVKRTTTEVFLKFHANNSSAVDLFCAALAWVLCEEESCISFVCVCVHVCMGVGEECGGQRGIIPYMRYILFYQAVSSTGAWGLPSRLGWLDNGPQRSGCPCLPSTRITSACYHAWLFLGIYLRFSWLFICGLQAQLSFLHPMCSSNVPITEGGERRCQIPCWHRFIPGQSILSLTLVSVAHPTFCFASLYGGLCSYGSKVLR